MNARDRLRRAGWTFWVPCVRSVLAIIATVWSMVEPQWIERLFDASPDEGSGESGIVDRRDLRLPGCRVAGRDPLEMARRPSGLSCRREQLANPPIVGAAGSRGLTPTISYSAGAC